MLGKIEGREIRGQQRIRPRVIRPFFLLAKGSWKSHGKGPGYKGPWETNIKINLF